jgi:hypothetical protein
MRIIGLMLIETLVCAGTFGAQAPSEYQPVATMKQLMVEIIHPASNEILFLINRGGPKNEAEWASLRRSSMTLAESGNLLMLRNPATDWARHSRSLVDAGAAAYKAAQDNDATALAALSGAIDASCTNCHKQYRPAVFPR